MPIGKNPIEKGSVINRMESPASEVGGTHRAKKNENKFSIMLSEPRYGFEDMVINDGMKEMLLDSVAIYRYRDLLFKQWNLDRFYKGRESALINLYGPPGTGKTMAANAIAKELDMKLIWVNYAEIESKFVGETSKNLVYLFREAEGKNAIILFDEADALLSRRVTDMSSATDVSVNQTRSVLLGLLDSFEGIVIFTTNFIQNYDPAFMRRIPYHIKFDLPNEENRKALLKMYLGGTVPNSIDIDYIAREYEGISGSDISNALLMSALRTARNEKKDMPQDYFEESLRHILEGKKANAGNHYNVKVYEREVSEEYALKQLNRGGEHK